MKLPLLLPFLLLVALFRANSVSAACPGTVNAQFTASQTTFCGAGPHAVSFTNTSNGTQVGAVTYEWANNGVLFSTTTGLTAPPAQSLTAPGTYTFRLISFDNVTPCTDTAFVTVTVLPAPVAGFTFAPNNACGNVPVAFTNTSTGTIAGTTYSWNFGDGTNATQVNPTHTYAAGGTYTVTLTMTNAAGCTSTSSQTVTLLPIPVAGFTADDGDGNTVYCLLPGDNTSSETVTFTNNTTGGTSYSWNFGDGSPVVNTGSAAPLNHAYTTYGTFNATLTATGPNGCTATAMVPIVFEKFVSASLTLSLTEYSGCAPHNLSTLTNLSVNASSYTWNFGDGTVITTTSLTPPTHAYTTNGNYTITLTASNSCNSATATISPIVIIDSPNGNFNMNVTNGCAPQTVTFSNSSTGAQPANNYQWNMGNGNTYTNVTNPPAQTYPTQGSYTITMIAGNACGGDTVIRTIFIDTIPHVELDLNPLIGCTPLVVDPTATWSSGTNVTWQWHVDGVYVDNTPLDIPNRTFTAPAGNAPVLHTIRVTVSNACGTSTDIDTVIVHPAVDALFTSNTTICAGGTINFTDASLGTNLSWSWNFGDGSPAVTTQHTSHVYTTPGTYTVTQTVTGFCGTDTRTTTITVIAIPTAAISATPLSACIGQPVTFTNSSSTTGTYNWNFGAGATPATSTLYTPPTVTYSSAGTKQIIFTINNGGCIDRDTVFVTINPLPTANFTLTPASGCDPLSVSFNNTSPVIAGQTYAWNFGNGQTSTLQNPPLQIYTTGSTNTVYTVTLVVTTPAGCTSTITRNVTVFPLPVAAFTIADDTLCQNQAFAFTNTSQFANSYSWTFGDGTSSTAVHPTHPYASSGNYTVQLIAQTANGCRDTVTHNLFVDSIPTAAFTSSIECFGTPTQFTNTSLGAPISWLWNFGDGSPPSTAANPAHTYTTAGTYTVSLTATNSVNCTHTITHPVVVNAVPVANFTSSHTCLGQPTIFTDATTGVTASWEWDFGDGATSTVHNPTHTYTAAGSYSIQLIAHAGSGCSDTVVHTLYVDSIPTVGFAFTSVCSQDTTFFTNLSTGNADSYSWNFGDGTTSTLPDPAHVYAAAGTFNVTLTATYTSSGCSSSSTQPVQAFPRTNPAFTVNVPCLGNPSNFTDVTTNTPVSWNWNFGDGSANATVQHPSHTYAAGGFYDVTLITANSFGCTDTLVQQIQIFGLPAAAFSADTVCQGTVTSFTDASSSPAVWNWNFGDGTTATTQHPAHLYATAGSFTAQLIVFNVPGCSDTIQHTVIVRPNPVAAFAADTACYSYANSFTDQSTPDVVSWEWTFGDGSPAGTTANVSHLYPAAGSYNAQLLVTNSFGCFDSQQQAVIVDPQPIAGFTNATVCARDHVHFQDTSIGSITYWEWDFGDGSPVSYVAAPDHVYTTGGLFPVQFIAGNANGCRDTTAVTIEVFTNPTPLFTVDTVCHLDLTHFTDQSTDAAPITSWFYDFGDGISTSTLQHPTYIYQQPGTYAVTLTIANTHGCDSSVTQNVVVNGVPEAEFTFDTVCWGSPTTFTDASTGAMPVSWFWDFGDGTTSTGGPVVQHSYATPGMYIVQLEADGGVGCTDEKYHVVTVSALVTAGINATDTSCLHTPVTFTDASSSSNGAIAAWAWDFGDGTPVVTTQHPAHTFTTAGTYTVTLTVTSTSGCVNSTTHSIYIPEVPAGIFAANAPCQQAPTQFNDQSTSAAGNITAWQWNFGDGSAFSNVQHPTHIYNSAGQFTVTLTVTSEYGCTGSISQQVEVFPKPVAQFTFATECGGEPIDLLDQSTGTIVALEWQYVNQVIGTAAQLAHVFPTDTDTHPVLLIVTTEHGCADSVLQNVITHPVVDFDYGPLTTAGCPVLDVQFFENSTTTGGGGIVNWLWDMGDGTYSFTNLPAHAYEDPGTYYISLQVITAEDCIYNDTLAYGIIVYPEPMAGFGYAPHDIDVFHAEVAFANTAEGAIDVEWDFGDFDYSNDWMPVHTYEDTGLYTVIQTVYNAYGCVDSTWQNIYVHGNYACYTPNAFTPDGDGHNDYFKVSGYGIETIDVLIFDRWGTLIARLTDVNDAWDGTYLGNPCQDGVYVWKMKTTDYRKIAREQTGHVTLLR